MNKYIVLSENDIQTLLNEKEVCCRTDNGESLILITEKKFKEMPPVAAFMSKKFHIPENSQIIDFHNTSGLLEE